MKGMPILLVAESWVPGHTTWCRRRRSGPSSAIHALRSAGRWAQPGKSSPQEVQRSDMASFCVVTSLRRFTCAEKKAPMASSGCFLPLSSLLGGEEEDMAGPPPSYK
uniref:Uncharacterized protein n=1 Tax=Triticum urartu TaxID=4572 RepID=A0A8R7QF13_TRIUA